MYIGRHRPGEGYTCTRRSCAASGETRAPQFAASRRLGRRLASQIIATQPRTRADCVISHLQSLAVDLLNPSPEQTAQTHKLKRLVQCVAVSSLHTLPLLGSTDFSHPCRSPNSYFMDVKVRARDFGSGRDDALDRGEGENFGQRR